MEKESKVHKKRVLAPIREQVENVGSVSSSLFKEFFVELYTMIKDIYSLIRQQSKTKKR